MQRDPRIEPMRGDWLTSGRVDVRVDNVECGQVYYSIFRARADAAPHAVRRAHLAAWRALAPLELGYFTETRAWDVGQEVTL